MASFRKHINDDDVPLCIWMFTGQQLAEYWDLLADKITSSIEKMNHKVGHRQTLPGGNLL